MQFNSNWSSPYKFIPGKDNLDIIDTWGCKGKLGIYLIRDESDRQNLYAGQATQQDIATRLRQEIKSSHNQSLKDYLLLDQHTVTVRWAECSNPIMAENLAIIGCEPSFNRRMSPWKGTDLPSKDEYLREATRLGIFTSQERSLDNLTKYLISDIETNPQLWERKPSPNRERKTYRERF